mgnify:CR=1 FL=1
MRVGHHTWHDSRCRDVAYPNLETGCWNLGAGKVKEQRRGSQSEPRRIYAYHNQKERPDEKRGVLLFWGAFSRRPSEELLKVLVAVAAESV